MSNPVRQEKERFYHKKENELARLWKNPTADEFDSEVYNDLTDEELDKGLKETIFHIRYEKVSRGITWIIKVAIISFVVFGVIGLLRFGIRQL